MFSQKKLRVVVQRIDGVFFPGINTLEFKDLPIEVDLNLVTLPAGISGKIKIYGISKKHMDAITTIKWKQAFIAQKAVRVYADDGDGEDLLFEGNIMSAVPNYNSAPDVCISIDACAGAYRNLLTVSPSSFQGQVSAHQVFQSICNQYGVGFMNYGVIGKMASNPTFNQNGLANRINAAAKMFDVYVVMENNVVKIYPNNGYSASNWKLTKQNYIGYPTFNSIGVDVKMDRLYYAMSLADFFTIDGSDVTAANDTWKIIKISYKLSTKIGGQWYMTVSGVRVGNILWQN